MGRENTISGLAGVEDDMYQVVDDNSAAAGTGLIDRRWSWTGRFQGYRFTDLRGRLRSWEQIRCTSSIGTLNFCAT